ncbi:ribonuclease T2 isoform X1 [Stegostoma tigrinum]|uniref:ribonuclease T2 isoform X1 n=1 Tax=Stegostoma tigrinum TaxID=3053191 RepID=UPI00202B4612|nr:ribonuclease T2 isoform X1 [Stegostoma tigrinum]XP_048391752.1 ribonuclease T2 isoform X1 [Stegostoma tigrinum]XP_048391753.1 ribonuclease T2 isoform X1 [Stegostoma tigrinum]
MAYRKNRENQRKCTFVWLLIIAMVLVETSDCKNHSWNILILSQHWPQTVCLMVSETCKVPQNIDYWTVHGLWPKRDEMCNNSWHFEIQNVMDILSELKLWWPDVLHPNSTQLWKHEWQKHGTCAATLQSLDTQNKYFSKALDLYHKINLNSVLKKLDILPSSKYYTLEMIENALVSVYGVTPKIQCLKGSSAQILGQIELCFTKEFEPLNCTHDVSGTNVTKDNKQSATSLNFSECELDQQIYYPPIEHLY